MSAHLLPLARFALSHIGQLYFEGCVVETVEFCCILSVHLCVIGLFSLYLVWISLSYKLVKGY